ncbi:polysaccharide pyruvyl transferase CsaB [Tissierella sp. MB52-C2]|uniref:polysaccharide pyruvyl transferase CsaB n=1 Tax=Tissierella sp. MB52-C2 TaxID=3070999 RepID=UPI00280B6FFA|nr:polysaccharide pyruvyl transferase CsaB [Tissierella sp. MB52-C2]WMM23745.1 polysaccharide pyruvyl transferase CsaB [Tissierella sp. MB52-C2]
MKVLHLISGGDTGGAKTHIISLMKAINKLIDAKIVCFIEDTFYHDAKDSGIPIEVFKQKARFDMSVVNRLAEEVEKQDYDIIHCHGARANFIGMFLKLKVNKPFITTIHSDYELDFKDNFYKKIIFTRLNKFSLKRFKNFIAISDTFKDMLVERGFKEDRIFTAYNGIDLDTDMEYLSKEEFFKKYGVEYNGETVVGIAARLDLVKDHETFIRAAANVLKKRKDIIFLIAGDGNERERLMSLAKELQIDKNLYFLGYIKDPHSFFNAIDINTLTSVSESFPYAILEGARLKKTIISTNVGGVSKLIEDGENGYLVQVGDIEALANRIITLAEDKEKIKIMGEKLFNKVREKYSSDAMAKEHLKIYGKILDNKGANNSILISGYYGFDNSGDDAILKAIVKDIKDHNEEIDIKVLSKSPIKTENAYNVKAVNRFEFKQVYKAMKSSKLFISGGGSLLQDITSTRSLLYYLATIKLARLFNKPVMVYANGIGPIEKKLNRFLTRRILNGVNLITLRDKDSEQFIKNLGVKNKNIMVTADPVFTLEPAPKSKIEEIFEKENIPKDKKFIGISIRKWKNTENLVNIMAEAISYMIDKYDVNIVLIPMHYPEDLDISLEINSMVNKEGSYVIKERYGVEEIMGIIKELEIIVAMRLHSLIYAATQEIPMVGLSYDPKVDGILRSLKMDYICNIETLEYNDLVDKIDYVWNNRTQLKGHLKEQHRELEEKALSNVKMALDLMESR